MSNELNGWTLFFSIFFGWCLGIMTMGAIGNNCKCNPTSSATVITTIPI
jgi:hypothetical protein